MTNVYDNAGHLERLGALARENEDLKRRLAELERQQQQQPVNARLLRLLKEYADSSSHLQETMGLAESARAALAAAEAQQAEPVQLTAEQVAKVDTAICEALGGAYDYLRGGIDFSLVADDSDRVASIREAVLQALGLVEGAEPLKAEPVPVEAIGRLLTEAMDKAVENGASSVSMPDDYVAVAAWLCRVEGADNG